MNGTVVAIYLAPERAKPMVSHSSVQAVPGKGVVGDHRFDPTGEKSKKKGAGREVTRIEQEAIEAVFRDYQIELGSNETRRNVLTRGVALNHLIGREFTVGAVRLKGIELCEPCQHLEQMTRKGVKEALVHRGGLCCQILTEGTISVGDEIRTA
jgi:MOSC domain-containing protein YiiM